MGLRIIVRSAAGEAGNRCGFLLLQEFTIRQQGS